MKPTKYSTAWEAYAKTVQYENLMQTLIGHRIAAVYAENIIRIAFDAGWNAKG
jgi:hypothetical protein